MRDTLAHIYGAEWYWLERWHGRTQSAPPSADDFPTISTIQRRLEEMDRSLVDYVASLTADDLRRVVQHKTTSGAAQADPFWQMLQHPRITVHITAARWQRCSDSLARKPRAPT